MKEIFSISPNKSHFFAFLNGQNFLEDELKELEKVIPAKVLVDAQDRELIIEYFAAGPVANSLLEKVATTLKEICDLQKVKFLKREAEPFSTELFSFLENKEDIIAKVRLRCSEAAPLLRAAEWVEDGLKLNIVFTGNSILEYVREKHLDVLLADILDAYFFVKNVEIDFSAAEGCVYEYTNEVVNQDYIRSLEKEEIKSNSETGEDLIYGKSITGKVRPLCDIHEEENKVTIEGTIVDFEERELRTGAIILKIAVKDDTDGLLIKIRFGDYKDNSNKNSDTKKECEQLKSKLKKGLIIRLCGNVKPDRYEHDELVMFNPQGICLVAKKTRMDNAKIKRVELHCHTKMSRLDAVTNIKDLMSTVKKWGHTSVAITDHGVVQAFPFAYDEIENTDFKLIFGVEGYLVPNVTNQRSYHIIILAKNPEGLRNLYRLISISHLKYLTKQRPHIPRDLINQYREGLIIGSACEAGELYQAILNKRSEEEIEEIAQFYDYLEIQPVANNMFLVRDGAVTEISTTADLEEINRKIYLLGKKLNKPVVATCDVHFLNQEDEILRRILQAGQGYSDADLQAPLYLRTTDEMLKEFKYLGEEAAFEVVVTNTNLISGQIERFKPIPDRDQLYSPIIPGAEKKIRDMTYQRAHDWYGDDLPQIVKERLEMELSAIIGNGFAVLYFIAHKLVKKSLDDGYLVGSRGSVGSSLVATMIDITEVNPLKPHYRCPKCRYSEFIVDNSVGSGFDLPEKKCSDCGTTMLRDGHDIPFAVFMGFNGDKVPDIDLNFSGVYQPQAHKYTEDLFGRDNVFRAGTIATIADKTAYGFVKKYYDNKGREVRNAFVDGIISGFSGIKRTTGQHPGGIMVVPRDMDIHYITPVQYPADDKNSGTITTHFDYHSINDRLVKLDILGHDDPTVIRMLEDLIGLPAKSIPFGDEETMSLFSSTDALGVTSAQINSDVGTYGIPEFGTHFVRQMIKDVQPKNFSDIVRVSGYSHGTDVWLNNAQDLIKSGVPVDDTISTRDDIMTSLIAKGVEPSKAFKIMEDCRKGKAHKQGLPTELLESMKNANVPQWYIDSCHKVQYLFPKAHAVAYVMMAYRIAYCKVHYPKEFYAAYFTVRAPKFDAALVLNGMEYMKKFVKEVYSQGNAAKVNDKDTATYLELAIEMLSRGYEFERIDIYRSDPHKFIVTPKGLLPPLAGLAGIGETAADNIARARQGPPFISQEDLKNRAGIPKSSLEALAAHGSLDGLPETDQIGLFG
ncbi:MAG: PolC-type DNA polymerase III [Negativicutes bacterium]|nr:PolC-type DNA polymerase III [Negativicutes bacterium]